MVKREYKSISIDDGLTSRGTTQPIRGRHVFDAKASDAKELLRKEGYIEELAVIIVSNCSCHDGDYLSGFAFGYKTIIEGTISDNVPVQ